MYQISCDGLILHDVRLSEEYRVLEPSCELEVNTAGTLSFKLAPNHPYYDRIQKLKSIVTLTQDGEWIFSGRVLNDEKDFQNVKKIEVEGELSFLSDSNQRLDEYHDTSVIDYFTAIITKHNAMVDDSKKFTVGSVTVEDSNDSVYRYSNYETTMKTIQEKLIDRLGGYLRTRHVDSTVYIDYVSDYENINTQTIDLGKNLLDLTQYVEGEDIATAIIPLGKKDENDTRLTIESVNDGVDYVFDQTAVDIYGWVFDTVTFDDVTLPENLKRKGQEELVKRKLLSIRLELNAVDLHLIDVDIERFKLGDKVKVISEPHGVNDYMMISKMTLDIEDPANNTICLGYTVQSMTDITNHDGIKDIIHEVFTDYGIQSEIQTIKQETKNLYSEISRTSESILLSVSSEYSLKTDTESVRQEYKTDIEERDKDITFRFTTVESDVKDIDGKITANQELLKEYIRFQGALIELGKVGNSFVAKLSNEKLAFLQDDIEIAYISNNKLYITDAEIRNKLTIGNDTNGFFDWIPRSNGNLSMKWRG